MKIGLISDIHADLDGLQLALDFLDGRGVDMVICAGDLVGKGKDAEQVLRKIQHLEIPCVQGNHDAMHADIQELVREVGDPSDSDYQAAALPDETFNYLKSLPLTRRFEWKGKRILLAHGTPWSNDEYLYPYSDYHKFMKVAQTAAAQVVVLGHTHQPMIAQVGEVWIINPGSVCRRYAEGSGTCAILTLPSGNAHIYDLETKRRVRADYVEH
jgi:putative phosphoesterase